MKKQAFTLVELIVVITILAILGTIGFISLQGFSSDARDSKRISELSEIRNGLQIYQARNSLVPAPSEQSVTIGSGTTNLIIQGYVGESVLNEIKMNGNPKDPLDDNKYYIYSVNSSKTRFQLLALLENDNNLTSYIVPKTHASYTNRYLYTLGQNIGILLNETTNTPLNELQSGTIDLNTDTNNYKVVFANNNQTSTLSGELLYNEIITQTNNNGTAQNNEPEEPQLTGWRALDTNCEIEDITIGTQTWAGCNSTLGDGFEWGQTDDNIGTSSYSGSISSCYPNYDGINNASEPTCQPGHELMASNAKANSWYSGTNLNNDSEYDTIWGKLYTWNSTVMGETDLLGNILNPDNNSICPTGRHVPSDLEWEYAEEYLYDELNPGTAPNNCRNTTNGFLCDGLGWSSASGTKDRSLANKLKIPLAGYRTTDGSTFFSHGSNANLWSSTPSSASAFRRNLIWGSSAVVRFALSQTNGFSVRCIKD